MLRKLQEHCKSIKTACYRNDTKMLQNVTKDVAKNVANGLAKDGCSIHTIVMLISILV